MIIKDLDYFRDVTPEIRGNSAAIALIALDLYYKKLSLREIKNHIWHIYGIDKPTSTLHSWILKFTRLMARTVQEIKPQVSNKWLGDAMAVKVKGRKMYLWNVMDYETRQHIVSILTDGGAKMKLTPQ